MLLLLGAALFGLLRLHGAVKTFEETVAEHVDQERAASALSVDFKTQVQEWKNTLLRGHDEAQRERFWKAFQKLEAEVQKNGQALLKTLDEPAQRATLEAFLNAHQTLGQRYRSGFEAFVAAQADHRVGDKAVSGVDRAPTQLLDALSKQIAQTAADVSAEARAQGRRALVASLSVMGVVMALGVFGAWRFSNGITRPLGDAVEAAQAVAGGDLSRPLVARGQNETADLLRALERMRQALCAVVGQVREGADGVSNASAEIATGNHDLSHRTEMQASALQQTAASLEEMSAAAQNTAEHARQADTMVRQANALGAQGGTAVGSVVSTMEAIQDSAKRIADITSVIDGIAFQTNILALNAAVEAARAGEQGRGFAVVASEVRSLAQRSATAAREIKALVGHSVERAGEGRVRVDQAQATIAQLLQAVTDVAGVVGQISTATGEQQAGMAQINQAVDHLDQGTQQNAALVEQSAAASESLRQQAQALVSAGAVFKLNPAA
ncbi:MAG: methyl-accepting chemotaxis protein [Rubrivivax sp.]